MGRGGKCPMSEVEETGYGDVASWELSDSLWARIEPLLRKVKSRYRGRGKQRKHVGGHRQADLAAGQGVHAVGVVVAVGGRDPVGQCSGHQPPGRVIGVVSAARILAQGRNLRQPAGWPGQRRSMPSDNPGK